MGWFHSIPKADTPSKEKQPNRAEKIVSAGGSPLMPFVDAYYLISHWQDLGMVSSGISGAVPLSAIEIDAWTRLSAVELEPWEFFALKQMSSAYCSELHLAEALDRPPPFGELATNFDRKVLNKKITNAFKSFIMAGKK